MSAADNNIFNNNNENQEDADTDGAEAEEADGADGVEADGVEADGAEADGVEADGADGVEADADTEEADGVEAENEIEELWGGEENRGTDANSSTEENNNVIHPELNIIAALLGFEPVLIPQNSGRIRQRDELSQPPSQKAFRNDNSERIIRESYTYIKLKSGEEFHFEEDDGKKIILNEILEPNRLIRNIISKIPIRIRERLEYLGKFTSDEEENEVGIQKKYTGSLKDAVYRAYIKEWRLRYIFKRVLILWRTYKMDKMCERGVDPITLSEPEKEVYIYDWLNKRKFIFDAKSLAILIESKLMYHEYGFPVPMYPRNPRNNVEFSYKQLISLYNQLKIYGELRWGLTTLREYNFNKNRWHMYHKSALTMNSIRVSISLLDSYDARDLFSDFIFAKMEELGLSYSTYICDAYQAAMIKEPTHWYLEKLKSLAVSHYEAEHFGHNRKRIINAACVRVFRKHNQFMGDLKSKHII